MKSNWIGAILLIVLVSVSSCMKELESELDQTIERDDRLVQEYLNRNDINAIETPVGYYYTKDVTNDIGNQIVNNDIVGIYYEIRTTDDQLIDSYMDKSKESKIYRHSEAGLVPRAMNFASGLAKEGESLTLFVPSYLGYQDYMYQQLILPNSNLVIKVEYARTYTEDEVKEIEEQLILDYIEENELTGFERIDDGLYIKITNNSTDTEAQSSAGDMVFFTYKLKQMTDGALLAETSNTTNPFQVSVGRADNLKFLNLSLNGVSKDAEVMVLTPSHLAFGVTTQILPIQIRKDLFDKGLIQQIARPFEPILFDAKVIDVR